MVTGWCKRKVRRYEPIFFSNDVYFRPNGLSDIVILCSRPNSCCQRKFFDMPVLSLGCFHERVAMTVKQI